MRQSPATLVFLLCAILGCGKSTASAPLDGLSGPVGRDDGGILSQKWMARHLELCERIDSMPTEILFLGDSITHFWEPTELWLRDGSAHWKQHYGGRNAVNLGVAGDEVSHLRWRVEQTDFSSVQPRVVIVNIGTNNFVSRVPDKTAADYASLVGVLTELFPTSEILLLGVFPRGQLADHPGRAFTARLNQLNATLADGKKVHYLDIGDAFLEADGSISPDVMPDFLHLSERGYEIWAEAMEPKLAELLAKSAGGVTKQ